MSDHSSNNKRIAKNTTMLYFRQLFTLFISLYTSSLTLKVLGETDYGIYAAVGGFTALISILTNSLTTGTQRFITYELGRGDLVKLNRVYCTSINIHVILAVFLLIVGEIVGIWFVFNKMTIPPEKITSAIWILQFTLLNSAFSLINTPNSAEIVAHEDIGAWAIVSIIDTILKLLSVITLYFISWDKLITYSFFLFIIQLLNRGISVAWCKIKYPEVSYKFIWDIELFKSMLTISGWSSLSKLSQTGFMQGINILLNVAFGPIVNAAYAIALQAYTGIKQFCNNFQIAAMPQIVKSYSIGDISRVQRLLLSVCKLSFFMIYFISLPFLLNAEFVLKLWLTDVPNYTQVFFVLLLIYAFSDIFSTPLDTVAQAVGKLKKYSIYVSLGILSSLLISIFAVKYGAGPKTIFIIAIIISWCCLFIRLYCLKQIFSINIKGFCLNVISVCFKVVVISLILPLLFTFVNLGNQFLYLLLSFCLSFVSVLCSVFYFGLNNEERTLVFDFLSKFKKKLTQRH